MSNLQVRPLQVNDFTGGITDDVINAPLNFYEEGDNLVVLQNKSLQSRPGSYIDERVTDPQIPLGLARISSLINYANDDTLLVHSGARMYYRDPVAYSTLTGPTGNHLWTNATVTNHMTHAEWKKHTIVSNDSFERPRKIYKDGGGTLQLRTAGLPYLATDPTITPSVAGSNTYLYAFCYFYEYIVANETFQDFGPTTVLEVLNADEPSTNQINISAIPVLANGADENWDTTAIKVKIYRTINAGTTLFEVGEVTNGTTVFVDTMSDADAGDNQTIYTNDGSLDNEPPPLAKFVHTVGELTYYAHFKEGTDILEYDVQQSKPSDPDSCPGEMRGRVEDVIQGISSIQSIPIVGCQKHIYRFQGIFDGQGRGFMSPVRIHDTAGCVSHRSFVQAEDLLYWAGVDGFYATDGYRVVHISDHLNIRYARFLAACSDPENIVGTYDEKNKRILWTFQNDSTLSDNNMVFELDLRFSASGKQIKEKASFRTWSGGESFYPTCLALYNNKIVRGDTRGYVFVHDDSEYNDDKVDVLRAPSAWVKQSIEYNFKHIATNFGFPLLRKWVPKVLLTAQNITNVTIGMFAINDQNGVERVIQPIRYRRNLTWGDPEFVWGDSQFVWNSASMIKQSRRMPKKGLRCHYMQFIIRNAFAIITNSDSLGTATHNPATGTLLLDTAAVADWPEDSEGYFVAFEQDNYQTLYEVDVRTADTLTLINSNTGPNGSTKWQLHGIRKDERINILDFTLSFAPLSDSHSPFNVGQAGENA